KYNPPTGDGPRSERPGRFVPRVAAAGEVLLRPAGTSAPLRRRVRAVAVAVPRPAPDRTGAAAPHGTPGGDIGLRRVERDRPGRPAGSAGAGGAPRVGEGPPREGDS